MRPPNSDRILDTVSRISPWLLLAVAGVLGAVCVRAEEHGLWFQAQATLAAILFLLVLMLWDQSRKHEETLSLSPDAATYRQTLKRLLLFVGAGVIAILLNAIRYQHWPSGLVARAVGYGILVAGAAFITGVLVGFLFGVPSAGPFKTSDKQAATVAPSQEGGAPGEQSQSSSSLYNTNLDQISDWLTKVILGASLVELNKLPPLIGQLADFMARGVDPAQNASNPPVALAILGYFSSCGMLYGYIWTKYEIAATSRRPSSDAPALAAVDRWLNQPPGPRDDQARAEMVKYIKAASPGAKVRIFLQAEKYRKPSTEEVNERSLPVFQALVEADADEIFHRHRSQYALALMGKKVPDWNAALDLLNDAIRLRDRSGDYGWREYEIARAVCQIRLDPQYNNGRASAQDVRVAILADLEKAKALLSDPAANIDQKWRTLIDDWKKVNAVAA